MNNYYYTVGDVKKISIWQLLEGIKKSCSGYKSAKLTWTIGGSIGFDAFVGGEIESFVHLYYRQADVITKEKRDFGYKVFLTTTPCYFGGKRYWFQCPTCGGRAGTLYKLGNYFTCRNCAHLTYESKRENRRYPRFFQIYGIRSAYKARELKSKIKRYSYAGKITKKFSRVLKLQDIFLESISREKEINGLVSFGNKRI
jgi:hypothetical protein